VREREDEDKEAKNRKSRKSRKNRWLPAHHKGSQNPGGNPKQVRGNDGDDIFENKRVDYGKQIVSQLATQLTAKYERSFETIAV